MMHNRRSFLAASTATFLVGATQVSTSQQPSGTSGTNTASGQKLVRQSAQNLFDLSNLEAQFRYRTQSYDQTLLGTGRYLQAGEGPEKQFRLELSTQLKNRQATQQTICGKQYLWMRRDFGGTTQSLARVSLRRLREAIEEAGSPLAVDPSPTWLGLVSLPKMLVSLANWFVFEPAQPDTLGDRQVLHLRGTINTDMRDSLLGGKPGQGREQLPDAVEIILGTDKALPLFPYRIEYLKAAKPDASLTPLLTLDFFNVKVQTAIDPREFDYAPGDQEVEDRTRLFLERLGFQAKER